MRSIIGTFLIALLFPIAIGTAQTSLEVSRGWDGRERAGRWNPLFVRASDRWAREVIVDLNAATEGGFGTVTTEHVAIGPTKGTFELYAPSHYAPASQGVVVVRDADSERTLGQSPARLMHSTTQPAQIGPNGIFIGISGSQAGMDGVRLSGVADAGYLPPRLLPRSAIGYDGIECLFLNQPDLNGLELQQQRAILDWVRGGGSLLLAPSDRPLPTESLLLSTLPCSIGDMEMIDVPPTVVERAGIMPRFAHLISRRLNPRPDAHEMELIRGSKITGYWGRFGMGRIFVAPIDLASIDFEPGQLKDKSALFWGPLLTVLTGEPPREPKRQYDTPFYGYQSESEDQQREGAAVGTVCDFVAGPGSSSPRRIPLVLLAIFVAVGPVDSIVLFALGQRWWTWTTVAGWVALLAGGVAFLMPHLRPARIECRSVRLIDQVDDATVAATDLVGLSCAGGKSKYVSGPAADGRWWQPAVPGLVQPQNARAQSDMAFYLSDSGNQARRLEVVPGEGRFLRADQTQSGPPILKVSLALAERDHAMLVVGTIQNVSPHPLTKIRIRTKFGVISPPNAAGGNLMPGQVLEISLPAAGEPFAPQKLEAQYQSYGSFGSRHLDAIVPESDLWAVAADLSGRRSLRVDEYVDHLGGFCCVYAQRVDPSPVFISAGGSPGEQAFCWVRALAPLGR